MREYVAPLRIHLVLHPDNAGWIIEKMAHRLAEYLSADQVIISISPGSRSDVDVNHWMSYAFANEPQPTRATMFITHVDDPYKVRLIQQELATGIDLGICMSSESVSRLVTLGVPREALCYVPPAHDNSVVARRIRIGITTRVYADGRKREEMLVRLARSMSLESFHFQIFGAGWDSVVPELERAGARVEYYPGSSDYQADYTQIVEHLPAFDYYLYLGMDEGSLGTLDAIAAGVKTIVTAQGFHRDLGAAVTHGFVTLAELRGVMEQLANERSTRLAAAADLTWDRFAARHLLIWKALVAGDRQRIPQLLGQANIPQRDSDTSKLESLAFRARALHPVRIVSALSHWGPLKPLGEAWRRRRRANASER
jgi:hypothetical protein